MITILTQEEHTFVRGMKFQLRSWQPSTSVQVTLSVKRQAVSSAMDEKKQTTIIKFQISPY